MSKKNKKTVNKVEGVSSKPVSMPFRDSVSMGVNRTGIILSNLTIAVFCFSFLLGIGSFLATIVYPVIVILNYLIVIAISILSIGLIYLRGVKFENLIIFKFSGMNNISKFMEFLTHSFPIALWVLFGLSVASFIMLLIDKKHRMVGRIVFLGIVMALSLALALAFQLGGIVII